MESLTVQMNRILKEYSEEVQDATNKSIEKVAKESVRKLKNTSPKRPGHGEYARGWTIKREKGRGNIATLIVHNKQYQLTHLLENGHVVVNKYGTYGRAPAKKHIKPVEEEANTELPREIERQLT